MKNKKIVLAWIILIILLLMLIVLNYVRFFGFYNSYEQDVEIEEVDNSTSEAIDEALTDIVNNFNNDEEIKKYQNEQTTIKALLKNHSIYISYTNETTTTYEFNYHKLILSINIKNQEENLTKFNKIYKILIKAIQKRIKNETNVEELINLHINDGVELIGIDKNIDNDKFTYKIDITKKITKKEGE